MVEIDRVEFLENLGNPPTLGLVAYEDRYGRPAAAQVGVIPAAIVLWDILAKQPIPKSAAVFAFQALRA